MMLPPPPHTDGERARARRITQCGGGGRKRVSLLVGFVCLLLFLPFFCAHLHLSLLPPVSLSLSLSSPSITGVVRRGGMGDRGRGKHPARGGRRVEEVVALESEEPSSSTATKSRQPPPPAGLVRWMRREEEEEDAGRGCWSWRQWRSPPPPPPTPR